MHLRDRFAALFEVAGVFITGALVARLVGRALGSSAGGIRQMPAGGSIDYLSLAGQAASALLLRYGIILGLAFVIGWWHRRRTAADYGVSSGVLSWRELLSTAVVLFAAGGLLPRMLFTIKDHVSLGREPSHWKVLSSTNSFEFWVYMAVASYGLVPVVEELFFRGYVQTRLGEAFGDGAAIVMTAIAFTLSHRQYFIASVIGAGMLLSLFTSSLFAGYARHRFGTLVPGILAHAVGNVPFRDSAHIALLVAMLVVLFAARHALLAHFRSLVALISTAGIVSSAALAALVIAIVLSLALAAPATLLPLGLGVLLFALAVELREKRARVGPRPSVSSTFPARR